MEEGLLLELPLGKASESFNLEKTVCSHGFFMMAPNHWEPLSKTLLRPLRLHSSSSPNSVMVRISHPSHRPHCLHLLVSHSAMGIASLSSEDHQALLTQVSRMLRLSESDDKVSSEFRKVYHSSSGNFACGKVFRSPSLFEDMVKCILLCNCQWPRTLSMAQSLCDFQMELQHQSVTADFIPKTPAKKESTEINASSQEQVEDVRKSNSLCLSGRIGNFPTPSELANVDENFLAKRCNLGYRAGRIVKLSQDIVQGRIQLDQLEETSMERSLSNYDKLAQQLKQIHGFGSFTCANVLMCMGFYHVIPVDSETIRHLKQVHARKFHIKSVEQDVQKIYAKYAPYQFLAYWSEVWDFYGKRFGKLSEMPLSDYKLITASNMRKNKRRKRG